MAPIWWEAGRCSRCGQPVYRGESCYCIDGTMICDDCLDAFARQLLRPYRRQMGEVER